MLAVPAGNVFPPTRMRAAASSKPRAPPLQRILARGNAFPPAILDGPPRTTHRVRVTTRILHRGNAFPRGRIHAVGDTKRALPAGNAFPPCIPCADGAQMLVDVAATQLVSPSRRFDVPRHAKSTKIQRDRGMIKGLRAHTETLRFVSLGKGPNVEAETVVAMYQKHLDALLDATEKEMAWKTALLVERRLEAALKKTHLQVQRYVEGVFGEDAIELRRFGLKPRKKAVTSIDTKLRAVEKRRETRRLRGTMGKRQRKKIKAGR